MAANGFRTAGIPIENRTSTPVALDREEALERGQAHPLADAVPLIRSRLASSADASDHLIVISDADGMLLEIEGNARVHSRTADSTNFTEGAMWGEQSAGTNAIGTALAADHPVQIFATEHFIEVVHPWTCSAAPVRWPSLPPTRSNRTCVGACGSATAVCVRATRCGSRMPGACGQS
jgi:hypothetical protein